jgi:hypothetical protein
MATLTRQQAAVLISNAEFIEQVTLLSVRRAITVGNTAASALPVKDAKYANFACSIISDRSNGFVPAMTRAVALAVDAADPVAPTDTEVTTAIASVWGTFAGAGPADNV